jgi:hypothetical protein
MITAAVPGASDSIAGLDVLAEALFCSCLQPSDRPGPERVRSAVQDELHRYHGALGACAPDVAFHYGERPELAAARMRWCRALIAAAYRPSGR